MKKGFWHFATALVFLMLFPGAWGKGAKIESLNFREKGKFSELEIVFDQNNVGVENFAVKNDKQIILDIKDVKASARVLRAFDTSEFKGSIVYISPYRKVGDGDNVRITVQLRDNVNYDVKRGIKKVTLLVENRFGAFASGKSKSQEEAKIASNKKSTLADYHIPRSESLEDILENLTLSGRKKYIGRKISLNAKDLPVSDILRAISETSGFNIITTDEIKKLPPMSLSLNNTPWDQVLDTVLSLNKLVVTQNGSILAVQTLQTATKIKEEEAKNKKLNVKELPRVTKVIPLSYAQTAEIVKIVQEYLTPNSSETARDGGRVSEDVRTNSIIVKDAIDVVERIVKIVEVLDTQTPQVLIESKIVEVEETHKKTLGLEDGIGYGYDPVGAQAASAASVGTINGTSGAGLDTGPGFSFNSAGGTLPSGGSGVFGFSIKQFKRIFDLNFRLQLLEEESYAKVLSSPKVVAQNKKKAVLGTVKTRSYLKQDALGATATSTAEQVEARLELSVTPQVTNEGSVSLNINVTKEDFGAQESPLLPPNKSGNNISTDVLVDNGATIVIGGVYEYNKSLSHKGIPILKDIPILGWLFRTPYNPNVTKREVIIFITPRIINQEQAGLGSS